MVDQKPQTNVVDAWRATGFVWDILVRIALPTTVFALFGRWLDRRWNTSPWFVLIGFICAMALSFFLVLRAARSFQASLKKSSD